MMTYFFLIVGFILLIKGADFFVEGSSSVAKLLKIPPVIVGLTIVAMGTSAPETAVSISAGLQGNNEIALSNIVGSNIFNLLIVVGVCAVIKPFVADHSIMKRDYPLTILISAFLWFFARDGQLSKMEGLLFMAAFFTYIGYMIYTSLKNRSQVDVPADTHSPAKSIVFILLGLAGVIIGGDWVVKGASAVALNFGLSQNLIGLTIVAIGTSLPELVTSIVAARKGESGLALGNVIGSNIFNVLFILGFSVFLTPIAVGAESVIDMIILLASTVFMFILVKKNKQVTRTQGFLSIVLYIAYTAYIILR